MTIRKLINVEEDVIRSQNQSPPVRAEDKLSWRRKIEKREDEWNIQRAEIREVAIRSYAAIQSNCSRCKFQIPRVAIKCNDCKQDLCYSCDKNFHFTSPYHKRRAIFCDTWTSVLLLPTQFLDKLGTLYCLGIPIYICLHSFLTILLFLFL